jgi:membrane-bound lytic murein transglycosylase D
MLQPALRAWRRSAHLSVAVLALLLSACASVPGPQQSVGQGPALAAPGPDDTVPRTAPGPASPGSLTRIDAPLARAEAAQAPLPQTLDLTAPADDVWERIRRGYAIPNLDTERVREWEKFYSARPEFLYRTAERAGKYLFHIVEEIERRGLPTELALLPFVESAFNPHALSRAQAAGLWQFIPSTGKQFGLEQVTGLDERRDPVASTSAALDYLAYLFELQGDWYLALASYNWGEGAVRRSMERNRSRNEPTDYLSIDMPAETRDYVPKLQAIKNIIARPDAFNVRLPVVENEPYFVMVPKNRSIDLRLAARLAGMPLDEFRLLNPAHTRSTIRVRQGSGTALLLPAEKANEFLAKLEAYQGPLISSREHRVGKGDTLTSVAQRYRVSVAELRDINGLRANAALRPGQVLLLPEPPLRAQAPAPRTTSTAKTRTHRVAKGDTLIEIARRYGTTVDALRKTNKLRGNVLRAGQTLKLP